MSRSSHSLAIEAQTHQQQTLPKSSDQSQHCYQELLDKSKKLFLHGQPAGRPVAKSSDLPP
jgi:hypothetical protein